LTSNTATCASCGRTIAAAFATCPFCGKPIRGGVAEAAPGDEALPARLAPGGVLPGAVVAEGPRYGLLSKMKIPFALLLLVGGGVVLTTLSDGGGGGVSLYVVNVSDLGPLHVFLDGKPVAPRLPPTMTEDPAAVRAVSLKPGRHRVEARNSQGTVIEVGDFEVTAVTRAVLFSPARRATTCFAMMTHGGPNGRDRAEYFPAQQNLWPLTRSIDAWLQPAKVQDEAAADQADAPRSVRLVPCPEAQEG
jgi:hypothetical protein